jgi:Asp-tRNA(Asn)/Glu-tRNA(Gln) amidotransferase A subunit family amidase
LNGAFTAPFNVTGQPAVSLPLGRAGSPGRDGPGLPIGVQLVARRGGDRVLLALAAALERAMR